MARGGIKSLSPGGRGRRPGSQSCAPAFFAQELSDIAQPGARTKHAFDSHGGQDSIVFLWDDPAPKNRHMVAPKFLIS